MKKVIVKNQEGVQFDESGILESQVDIDFFISQRPDWVCEVIDVTAEVEAKKAKAEKKKNFEFKGATIAQLRAELNEWLQLQKES